MYIYIYIYVKLPLKNLNSNPYPLYPTNIYTYRVIIAPRVCSNYDAKNLAI